jgi:head-tail adaptor
MLSPNELVALRRDAALTLNQVATIERKTIVQDGFDTTETWTNVQTNVPCRVFEPSGIRAYEGSFGNREQSNGYPIIRLPWATNVTEADRVIVGTRRFEVTRRVETSYGALTTLLCTEAR